MFHKEMNKTWSIVPTQWDIEAEKSAFGAIRKKLSGAGARPTLATQ